MQILLNRVREHHFMDYNRTDWIGNASDVGVFVGFMKVGAFT